MNIGGRAVVPGRASLSADGVRNGLPPGMLAALILLGAGALSTLLPPGPPPCPRSPRALSQGRRGRTRGRSPSRGRARTAG